MLYTIILILLEGLVIFILSKSLAKKKAMIKIAVKNYEELRQKHTDEIRRGTEYLEELSHVKTKIASLKADYPNVDGPGLADDLNGLLRNTGRTGPDRTDTDPDT